MSSIPGAPDSPGESDQAQPVFVTYPAKFDVPAETGGTQEMGARYFRGRPAVRSLIGMPPRCAAYDDSLRLAGCRRCHAPRSRADSVSLVAELQAQPNRLAQIRRNNVSIRSDVTTGCMRWRAITSTRWVCR